MESVNSTFSQGGFQPIGEAVTSPGFNSAGFQIPAAPQKSLKGLPLRPKKRIIICCDGTWQSSSHGAQTVPSNVGKISRSIASWYIDEQGLMAPQIVYYDAGVGTAMNKLEAFWNGLRGAGLDENVCEAYNFLANNYSPGDELFFFGFSRGAYTVRACAGLVCRVGICQPSAMTKFWEMYANYKAIKPDEPIEESLWAKEWRLDQPPEKYTVKVKGVDWEFTKGSGHRWFSESRKDIQIKVVGVWDTVGSLGYPENVWKDVTAWNKPYGFHNTDIHPQIENAFHALGLEERRIAFGPTLWSLPPGSKTNLIQCWFPGVHVNIGGGSGDGMKDREEGFHEQDGPKKAKSGGKGRSKGDLEIMSITTFFWMVDRCNPFLLFKIDQNIIEDYRRALNIIMDRNKTEDPEYKKYGGWGVAPVIDSFQGVMTAAGAETRTPGHYFLDKSHAHNHEHHHKQTNEYMHPVVSHAQEQIGYEPDALKGFKRVSRGPGKGWHWVKTYKHDEPGILKRGWSYLFGTAVQSTTEDDVVSIPEFVMPQPGVHENGLYWVPGERALIQLAGDRVGGYVPPEKRVRSKSLQTDQEGVQFMWKLDEENKDLEELTAWKKQKMTSTNMAYPYQWD